MVALTLGWDRSQLGALRERGLERALTRALGKAGGDAIRAISAASTRAVRFRKRVKARRVREAFSLRFPRGAKHIDDLAWALDVKKVPIPLADYPRSQTKRGVTVGVNKGKRTLIKSAFIATMKSGHVGVFVRERDAAIASGRDGKGRLRKGRLPIRELFSSTVFDVFGDGGMIPSVLQRGQIVFGNSFARLLPLEIAKGR